MVWPFASAAPVPAVTTLLAVFFTANGFLNVTAGLAATSPVTVTGAREVGSGVAATATPIEATKAEETTRRSTTKRRTTAAFTGNSKGGGTAPFTLPAAPAGQTAGR